MAEPTVGQVVDGRYELEQVIGKGGMGCVFRARHVVTHGKVALKILTDTVDAELQQRFLAEARAAATIGHPAIVAVSDASRTPDGELYIVMELLAGKPLRDSLRSGLPGDQIRRVGLELLDALGAAHQRGIVHRDLKPENIFLLAGTGAVKVLDFGIAKVLGAATTSTISGHILGTIEYMAPEQLLDAANVDGRADLWAAGIILYELIAGVRPFGGSTREAKYTALATEEPMAIEDVVPVSPDVAAFFHTALARDPNARFQTAAQMADALRRLSMVPQTSTHTAQTEVGATLGTGAANWAGVPDLRRTVFGARAHPGSIPPPDVTGGARVQPPPQVSGHAMQAPAAPSSAKKLALAGMLVAVAFGIAFAVVMATRKKSDDGKVVDAGVVVAQPPDAAVKVPVTRDATEIVDQWAPPDAVVIVDNRPVIAGSCEDQCQRAAKCDLALSTCAADCKEDSEQHRCLERAKTCEEIAGCYWRKRCNRPVRTGTASCTVGLTCLVDAQKRDASRSEECSLCIDQFSPQTALDRARLQICETNAREATNNLIVNGGTPTANNSKSCDVYFCK